MSDLNPDARRLVNLARQARTPGDEAKSRIAERLAVPLAASVAAGTTLGAAKAAAGAEVAKVASASLFASLGVKVALGVAVTAAAGALLVTQLRPASTPSPAPSHVERAAAPASAAAPEPVSAPEIVEAPSDSSLPLPKNQPAPVKAPLGHGAPPAQDLEQEAALLHEAQTAWRAGQSAQALSLANQHAQRFPHSQLANERDVLRVLSLCKLGQTAAAKQVGARLLRTAKGSPWYQSVAASCAAP